MVETDADSTPDLPPTLAALLRIADTTEVVVAEWAMTGFEFSDDSPPLPSGNEERQDLGGSDQQDAGQEEQKPGRDSGREGRGPRSTGAGFLPGEVLDPSLLPIRIERLQQHVQRVGEVHTGLGLKRLELSNRRRGREIDLHAGIGQRYGEQFQWGEGGPTGKRPAMLDGPLPELNGGKGAPEVPGRAIRILAQNPRGEWGASAVAAETKIGKLLRGRPADIRIEKKREQ